MVKNAKTVQKIQFSKEIKLLTFLQLFFWQFLTSKLYFQKYTKF